MNVAVAVAVTHPSWVFRTYNTTRLICIQSYGSLHSEILVILISAGYDIVWNSNFKLTCFSQMSTGYIIQLM